MVSVLFSASGDRGQFEDYSFVLGASDFRGAVDVAERIEGYFRAGAIPVIGQSFETVDAGVAPLTAGGRSQLKDVARVGIQSAAGGCAPEIACGIESEASLRQSAFVSRSEGVENGQLPVSASGRRQLEDGAVFKCLRAAEGGSSV